MSKDNCEHKNTEYQARERDTDTEEYLMCEDCGEFLDLEEFDYMLYSKMEILEINKGETK